MIFKVGDDSAGFATILTTSNYRTGNAGKKHRETHSPIENAGSGMCTQTSDSEHTWRRSGKHARRNAGEQLEMISAPSTGRMSSVPTSAPTRRMISATARAPER